MDKDFKDHGSNVAKNGVHEGIAIENESCNLGGIGDETTKYPTQALLGRWRGNICSLGNECLDEQQYCCQIDNAWGG